MTNPDQIAEVLEACEQRRAERRSFLRASGGAALFASTTMLAACGGGNDGGGDDSGIVLPPAPPPAPPPPPPTQTFSDGDILNFALNLEYLEAQFYSFAAFGTGLASNLLGGTGTQGGVTGGRQVAFQSQVVAQYAREIAVDERQHVAFLRRALGASAVAQPAINISGDANGAFTAAARSAGVVEANQNFDPYASDDNFLLGAFIFEDVGVTAYKGAAPLITSKVFLEAAAGILAAEAYHAALVRTVLFQRGVQTPSLYTATTRISDLRDAVDNLPDDVDQGIAPIGNMSNIVPVDANGLVFSRTAGDVLNIVYLTSSAASQGGFFPAGVNGAIRLSTAI
jgi:hypothetical protein